MSQESLLIFYRLTGTIGKNESISELTYTCSCNGTTCITVDYLTIQDKTEIGCWKIFKEEESVDILKILGLINNM